jgi:hypothetical protein
MISPHEPVRLTPDQLDFVRDRVTCQLDRPPAATALDRSTVKRNII